MKQSTTGSEQRSTQRATINPEAHSQWMQFYANALRDTLRKTNSRRRDVLEGLNTADWRALIYRELQADNWYAQPVVEQVHPAEITEVIEAEPLPLAASANGNGAYRNHSSK